MTSTLSDTPVSTVPTLETQRIILRAFRPSDAQDVFAYSSNPRIGHDAGWPVHLSIEDSLSFINDIASQGHVWAICLPDHGGLVTGSIGLISDPSRESEEIAMLGYAIGEPWWNKGYMTEAAREVLRFGFSELSLLLISVTHYPWNIASKKVIEKLSFHYEGTRRMAEKNAEGMWEDFSCYSLKREEWSPE